VLLEHGAKLVFGGGEGKVSNVQFLTQLKFLAAPLNLNRRG
jgi:hypothetical protein